MRPRNIFIFALPVTIAVLFIILALRRGDSGKNDTESILNLENAIIIQGLTMESDFDDNGGNKITGRIIRNDEFYTTHEEHRHSSKTETAKNGPDILARLKKDDMRWHATPYIIRKGDNIWQIAREHGTDYIEILKYNNITRPEHLDTGRKIHVIHKGGIFYRVKSGDTVSSIARRYRISEKTIIRHNGIKKKGMLLLTGTRIFLPDARGIEENNSVNSGNHGRKLPRLEKSSSGARDFAKAKLRFIWPLKGRVTSSFGNRIDPFSKRRSFHCGIDISSRPGTHVRAAESGRVIFSGWKDGYGKIVVLRHTGGYISVYAHNMKNMVINGQHVKRGKTIAYSGMSGAVTGAHLHFEIRKYLTPLNPMRFL